MSFFSKLREARRDKTRDELCAHLQSLGIEAQMVPRGRAEEKIYPGPRRSLGVIDIAEGPIPWVNVTIATSAVGRDEDFDTPYYLIRRSRYQNRARIPESAGESNICQKVRTRVVGTTKRRTRSHRGALGGRGLRFRYCTAPQPGRFISQRDNGRPKSGVNLGGKSSGRPRGNSCLP